MDRLAEPAARGNEQAPLRVAIGAMITPRDGFGYYKELLTYLGESLDRPVSFVDREKYNEINALLKAGDLDMAFVCSGPYVTGRREFGLELLVAPRAYGAEVYYSYIIVPRDSRAEALEDLRGKNFAFTDPDSNTGRLAPGWLLATMGETPDSYFGRYLYTYAHDRSIKAVAYGLVDGAAVDSLVWEYMNRKRPEILRAPGAFVEHPKLCRVPSETIRPRRARSASQRSGRVQGAPRGRLTCDA